MPEVVPITFDLSKTNTHEKNFPYDLGHLCMVWLVCTKKGLAVDIAIDEI
jgi:hypothetical protein